MGLLEAALLLGVFCELYLFADRVLKDVRDPRAFGWARADAHMRLGAERQVEPYDERTDG